MSVSCPPKSPLDQLAGLAERELGSAADPAEAESVLVARLSTVPDLRRRRGLRHPLVVVLALAACATLVVGGDSVTAIWQWAARASQDKLARLGARRHPWTGRFLVPSERTFRRVLGKLDADALDAALGGWAADVARGVAPAPVVAATPGPPEREQRRATQRSVEHPAPDGLLPAAAVDGKALRGARTPEGGRVFLVAAIDHATGAVLGQRQVPSKRGEGAAARDLLTGLRAPAMVWTLDALHTTKATARLITQDLHGHYILIIKGNQPIARDAAAALLSGPDADWVATTAIEDDRGHGRVERRTIRVAPADDACSPAPCRPSGSAATPQAWTASGPARRSCTGSPVCRPTWPAPRSSTTTSDGTGSWKIVCIGSVLRGPDPCRVTSLDPGDLAGGAVILRGCRARGW